MQVPYGQNFDFKIKRDNVKYSYECRAYKSVDYRSYVSKIGRKKHSCCRWLIVKAFSSLSNLSCTMNISSNTYLLQLIIRKRICIPSAKCH